MSTFNVVCKTILIMIYVIGLILSASKHGEASKYSFPYSLVGFIAVILLLYGSGFFS